MRHGNNVSAEVDHDEIKFNFIVLFIPFSLSLCLSLSLFLLFRRVFVSLTYTSCAWICLSIEQWTLCVFFGCRYKKVFSIFICCARFLLLLWGSSKCFKFIFALCMARVTLNLMNSITLIRFGMKWIIIKSLFGVAQCYACKIAANIIVVYA